MKHGIHPSFEDVESDMQANDALLSAVKIKARTYRNETVKLFDHNESSEIIESKPFVDLMDQLSGVPDVHKVTSEYSEDGPSITRYVLKAQILRKEKK